MKQLLLTGVLGLAVAAPVLAQIPMPDAREMSGIPRPVTDLPDGTVSVRLIRGELANNITGHPVELHGAGEQQVWRATTDDTGRAQFTGVSAGTLVHAFANVSGERLESQSFPFPSSGGVRLMLVASREAGAGAGGGVPAANAPPPAPVQAGSVKFGGDTRFVIEMGEDGLNVFYLLEVLNGAAGPVNPPAPIVLEMPANAVGTTVLQSTTARATAAGSRVTVNGPFEPGRTTVELAYSLPYGSGRQTIDQTLPIALDQLALIVQKTGSQMRLASAQLGGQREMTTDGRQYILGNGPALAEGGRFVLELSGLPHHSTMPRNVALALAVLLLAGGGWAASRRPNPGAEPRRQKLNARRELLFGHLVKLEEQRREGTIDQARYTARRRELLAQLERIYGALDEGLAA